MPTSPCGCITLLLFCSLLIDPVGGHGGLVSRGKDHACSFQQRLLCLRGGMGDAAADAPPPAAGTAEYLEKSCYPLHGAGDTDGVDLVMPQCILPKLSLSLASPSRQTHLIFLCALLSILSQPVSTDTIFRHCHEHANSCHTYKMQGEIDEPYSVLSVSHKLSGPDPVLVECLMKEIEEDPTNVRVRLLLCYQAQAFMTSCTHGTCSTCTSSLFARLAQSIAWIASSCLPLPALFFHGSPTSVSIATIMTTHQQSANLGQISQMFSFLRPGDVRTGQCPETL